MTSSGAAAAAGPGRRAEPRRRVPAEAARSRARLPRDRRLLRDGDRRIRAAQHRFFGRTAVVEVPELTAVDVDHLHDLTLAGCARQRHRAGAGPRTSTW